MIDTLSDVPPVPVAGEARLDALELRVGAVASLEVVVRDVRAQIVNVMKAAVAREPLQDPGSL